MEDHVEAGVAVRDPLPGKGAEVAADREEQAPLEVRLRRIMDYLDASLGNSNPLGANLGAVNADLMLLGYRLKQAIEKVLERSPNSLEVFEGLMPAISDYLRITKQIDRFSQLGIRLGRLKESTEAARSAVAVPVAKSEELTT